SESKTQRIARHVSLALYVMVGLALAVVVALTPQRFGTGSPWWLIFAACLSGLAVLAAIPQMLARRFYRGFALASLSAIILYAVAGFLTVPRLTELWISPPLAQ